MRGVPWLALLLTVSLLTVGVAAGPDAVRVGAFSGLDPDRILPPDWERLTISKNDRQTAYNLATVDSTVVVRAQSDGGASGLVRRTRIDPAEHPILTWRWRIEDTVPGGNAFTKDGDDFAARVYVTFDYDLGLGGRMKRAALQALGYDDIPARALNYVWANRAPTDTVFANAYTDWVMMMPVQTGSARTGTWQTERRNVAADYRAAFGEAPPAITGVAIMTDTDNTGATATAYYGDITFRAAPSPSRTASEAPGSR
jgi:hypothetical protein